MNPTIKLLRIIGSPFLSSTEVPNNEREAEELYVYTVKNRIPHLYLEALEKREMLGKLKLRHDKLYVNYLKLVDAVGRVSSFFTDLGVKHGIFKTVRPYLAATADIDVLIFGNKYMQTINAMLQEGYKLLGSGPESTTLYDDQSDMKIDVYKEVAASHIVYLDKVKIRGHLTKKRAPNGQFFQTLTREADLITVIAHSVIKEQLYSLGEYYTFLYYLAEMNAKEVCSLVNLVKGNYIIKATRSYMSITATLHQTAHGMVPKICKEILAELGYDTFERVRLIKNAFKTPHKYHILTTLKALQEKSTENRARRSMAMQLLSMLKPSFTGLLIKDVVQHIHRETY